jgi:hypothetical protein
MTTPDLLKAAELMARFGLRRSRFYELARQGAFDALKVKPTFGPRCYSRVLVERYLAGEPVFLPTFGRKRSGM